MQVPDTERQTCCRCKQDVTGTLKYTARKPLPAGFDKTVKLYDCSECAIRLLVKELRVSKSNQALFQDRAKQLDLELQNEKAAHQQTQAELNQKATELDGATQQCEAFRLAFRTYSKGLPQAARDSLNMRVTKQLASIQQQFAQKQAAWCEKNAVEAELTTAEHTKKAGMLRAKAKTVLARAEEQQMLLRKKEEELQQKKREKANEAPTGEPLKKKGKETEQND